MSHTPEPWAVSDSPYGAIISTASRELRQSWCVSTEDTGRNYSDEIAVANARRIVACVNACAGIETTVLEKENVVSYHKKARAERNTYRELCGELLEALKNSSAAAHMHTANQVCCGKVGQQCCGEPDVDWPAWAKQLMDDNHGAITKAEKVLGGDK